MKLRFTSLHDQQPGVIASMLKQCYANLVESDPKHWKPAIPKWEAFDCEAFEHPQTVGSCVFLSWLENQPVGFGSYDPRQKPLCGIIGHNCILPEFRGKGFGKQQIQEILRRFQAEGIRRAKVSTGAHPFFIPAQRMYIACGFQETGRHPLDNDSSQNAIEYEMDLASQALPAVNESKGQCTGDKNNVGNQTTQRISRAPEYRRDLDL